MSDTQISDEMVRVAAEALLAFRHGNTKHLTPEHARVLIEVISTFQIQAMWRPINEAPKDWSDVLLYDPKIESDWRHECEGYFDAEKSVWRSPVFGIISPTHYMPLPSPPRSPLNEALETMYWNIEPNGWMTVRKKSDSRWKDIATAPKDGTRILIWFVHANAAYSNDPIKEGWAAAHEAYWTDHNAGGWTWYGLGGVAKYWQPLPAPPVSRGE